MAVLIDIGGGSTQVTVVQQRQFVQSISRPIGAVRLTDRFVKSDPMNSRDFKVLERAIAEQFADVSWLTQQGGSLGESVGRFGTARD
jgi:exopolyphosphatase/guanosine-5'-triphosphate,3'-diphosphate pyrophosphatase